MAVKASATITLSFMVDVQAVYRYYKLQASTASAPSAPTTNPKTTPSGWTDAEPTYTEGSTNTLYFVDGTLFTNNTFSYTPVSKSTSYEAAKAAYNLANSAKDTVDNLEVGGRNYIFNSDNFTSGGSTASGITTSVENGVWKIVTTSGNGNWNAWSKSNAIKDNFKTGDAFTFSVEIKCDDGSTGKPNIYFKPGMGYYTMQGSVSTEYSTLYYTGTWNNTNNIAFHFGWSSTVGTFYIRRMKFEKGNKPSDWTPAPEDVEKSVTAIETRVTSVESKTTADAIVNTVKESSQFQAAGDYVTGTEAYSQLKQTVSGMNSTVQSHTGSISNIQQTVKGVQVRLENQQTVSNLVNKSRKLDGWGNVVSAGVTLSKNVSTSAPEFGEVTVAQFNASTSNTSAQSSYIQMTNAARVTSGKKYTFSMWARKVSGGNARPRFSMSSTNQSAIIAENLTTEWKRYSYTFTLGAISASGKYVDITTSFGVSVLADQTGVFEICCPQLEAGDTMNPWSANSVDETDYMSFTNEGLVIGDMTDDELGNNVLIDSNSMDVRSGSETLASFGSDGIWLGGKNNSIRMCDEARISVYKEAMGSVPADPSPYVFSIDMIDGAEKLDVRGGADNQLRSWIGVDAFTISDSSSASLHASYDVMDDNDTSYDAWLNLSANSTKSNAYLEADELTLYSDDLGIAGNNDIFISDASGEVAHFVGDTTASDPYISIGYGRYKNKSGTSYLYGNNVHVKAYENVYIDCLNGKSFVPYYRNGSMSITNLYTAGYVTDSKKKVVFTIPLERYCTHTTVSVTSASGGAFILRQGEAYTHGSAASKRVNPSSYTADHRGRFITVIATFSTLTNAVNNSPIGIDFSCTLTFS